MLFGRTSKLCFPLKVRKCRFHHHTREPPISADRLAKPSPSPDLEHASVMAGLHSGNARDYNSNSVLHNLEHLLNETPSSRRKHLI